MARTLAIKIRQLETGIKDVDIAREYGCSKQFVGQVIKGIKRSRELEKFIAARLGRPLWELFPRSSCQAA